MTRGSRRAVASDTGDTPLRPAAITDSSEPESSGLSDRQISTPDRHVSSLSQRPSAPAKSAAGGERSPDGTPLVHPGVGKMTPQRRRTVLELVEGPSGFYSIEVSVAPPQRKPPKLRVIRGGRTD